MTTPTYHKYKPTEFMPNANFPAPYTDATIWDTFFATPPSRSSTILSTRERNIASLRIENANLESRLQTMAAQATFDSKQSYSLDVGPPLMALWTFSAEEVASLANHKEVLSSVGELSASLAELIAQYRDMTSDDAAAAARLLGSFRSTLPGLKTRLGIPIPQQMISSLVHHRFIPLQALAPASLKRFEGGAKVPTVQHAPADLGSKSVACFDGPAFFGQGSSEYDLDGFANPPSDIIEALRNLLVIAKHATPENASPGANIAHNIEQHLNFVEERLAPDFKPDRWFRWSSNQIKAMYSRPPRQFSLLAHSMFLEKLKADNGRRIGGPQYCQTTRRLGHVRKKSPRGTTFG
ncbi:hypothetical protein FB45DRAFT_873678 [Roridomyces roridus]|uniref:Uncharacterized protein n=1 Tax=Roridomyces roridus TaxID=1738132 RepID=A0AAD7BA38_9AGAR|nr:hypothetical protein FB45DRAFT_873678 [Roridomyces roridus]